MDKCPFFFIYIIYLAGFGCVAVLSGCSGGASPETPSQPDTTKPTPKTQQLGINLNAGLYPKTLKYKRFKRAGPTKWIRATLNFFTLYKKYKAGKNWWDATRIKVYKTLQQHGYKTALSIRYHFRRNGLKIPEKSTQKYIEYMKFTTALLREVMPYTNLIIPGNEPFIAAPKGAKKSQKLIEFYEGTSARAHVYIKKYELNTPLFIGAFDNAYKPYRQNNQAYNNFLVFAKKTDWVDGVDIHIHHKNNKDISSSLEYVGNRIRKNQKIIVTEFTLTGWWNVHRRDELSAAFEAKYSPPG
jgi:hypothetical protein